MPISECYVLFLDLTGQFWTDVMELSRVSLIFWVEGGGGGGGYRKWPYNNGRDG